MKRLVRMTVAMKSLSENFCVAAFYGINHSVSGVEAYYRLSLRWFDSLGVEPDKMGVSGDGQMRNVSSFVRTSKKLARDGFNNITGFEMYATEPDAKIFWSDYICAADYEGQMNGTHVFVAVRDSIAALDSPIMAKIVGEAAALLKPVYGIGFVRKKQLGPRFYAIGILEGPAGQIPTDEEYEEKRRVCRWGDIGMPEQVYRRKPRAPLPCEHWAAPGIFGV